MVKGLKAIASKISGRKIMGVIVGIASVVTTIDSFVSEFRRDSEIEDMQKRLEKLEKN